MPGLIIWKNRQFDKLRKDMDRMFDRVWGEFGLPALPRIGREFPAIDLTETEDNLIAKVELPGIDPEGIDIDISENRLAMKAEIKQDLVSDKEGVVRRERRASSFSRTLQLPCRIVVDDVKATYKKGVLNIIMPKYKREKIRVVKIEI